MARPIRIFTPEEEAFICNSAIDGGKNGTIAGALGINVNTLTNRFSGLLKKYRAFRKLKIAGIQTRQAVTSPQMAIWLGKQDLGQVDKQVIDTHDKTDVKPKTAKELRAHKAAARAYAEAMSSTEPTIVKLKEGA